MKRTKNRMLLIAITISLLTITALATCWAIASHAADESIDGTEWVDSISVQKLPDGKSASTDYVDVAPGEHVSVYDGVRFKSTFHIPKGTLGAKKRVAFPIDGITFEVLVNSYADQYYPAKGTVYGNSMKYGDLSFGKAADGRYYAYIDFTDEAVLDNETSELSDGNFQFNVTTPNVFPGEEQNVTIGTQSVDFSVDRAKITVVKEAAGTPEACKSTDALGSSTNCFYWTATVTNTGSVPLKDADLFDCRVPDSTTGNKYCVGLGSKWVLSSITENGNNADTDNRTLDAGQSYTFAIKTQVSKTELSDNVQAFHNYFGVEAYNPYIEGAANTSTMCTTVVGDWAEQENPFYREIPKVKVDKAQDEHADIQYINKVTGAACKHGEENCTARVDWVVTLTNEGKADAENLTLVEQGTGTYFTDAQQQEIINAIKDEGGINATWRTENSNEDGAITGNITFNDPLKAGASFTFTYHTTANVGPNDPDVGRVNCATLEAQGVQIDSKCRGIEYGLESLAKKTYPNVTGMSSPAGDIKYTWGIFSKLTSTHIGKMLVLHEELPTGAKTAIVGVEHDIDEKTQDDYYKSDSGLKGTPLYALPDIGKTLSIPDYTGEWNNGYPVKYMVTRTDATHYDILIPNAHALESAWISPVMDTDYLEEHGTPDTSSGKYCQVLTMQNTVTSQLAENLNYTAGSIATEEANYSLKYIDGAFEKTARSEAVSNSVCTSNSKNGYGWNAEQMSGSSTVLYTVQFNNNGLKLNNGNPITLKDAVSNVPDDAAVSFGGWYRVNESRNTIYDDNDNPNYGAAVTSATVDWDGTANALTFTVPDATPIVIRYKLTFTSPNDSIPSVKNTVTSTSSIPDIMKQFDYTGDIPISHSGGSATANSITILKQSTDSTPVKLQGAVFSISKWDGSKYVKDGEATTSSEGTVKVGSLECGTAYEVRETTAPDGYDLDGTPQYFYMKGCGTDSKNRPADFSGNVLVAGSVLTFRDAKTLLYNLYWMKSDKDDMAVASKGGVNQPSTLLAGSEWDLKKGGKTVKHIVDNGENDTCLAANWSPTDGKGCLGIALTAGTYELAETKAPNGYDPLAKPLKFSIVNENGSVNLQWDEAPADTDTTPNPTVSLTDANGYWIDFIAGDGKTRIPPASPQDSGLPKTGARLSIAVLSIMAAVSLIGVGVAKRRNA